MQTIRARNSRKIFALLLIFVTHLYFVPVSSLAQTDEERRPWTTTGATGVVDEEDLNIVSLNEFAAGLKNGSTGTVNIRYNIVALDGITLGVQQACYTTTVRVRYRDGDNAGTSDQVRFTIRATSLLTGGSTAIYTFDSNERPAAQANAFRSVEDTGLDLDFDFTQNAYWIEAEITRGAATGFANLGTIQISQTPTTCEVTASNE